jgi:hypothetical protein
LGRYAARLQQLATNARAKKLGLWGACPGTPYVPTENVATALKTSSAVGSTAKSARPWNKSCYPAWGFKPGCYPTSDSYLVDAFARWIGECLPGNTTSCEQEARAYYYPDCVASSYRADCARIFTALIEDGRRIARRNVRP